LIKLNEIAKIYEKTFHTDFWNTLYIFSFLKKFEMDEEDVIPLPNVNLAIFKENVIQWETDHKDDPSPPENDENHEKNTNDISS
jgi:hypothetical protein